ncbi:MAG: hypothetical protein AAGF45_07530 [Pseudomonadota bacterium]
MGVEFTSVVVVENLAGAVWPDALHAAAAVPGRNRGEAIVLLTEQSDPTPETLHAQLKAEGLPERFLPDRIITVEQIPVLGTGKVDTVAVTKLALELTAD